jgi:hypothetical protein
MDENEKFVCDHWERAQVCPHPHDQRCWISLGGRTFTRVTVPESISDYAENEAAAWSAAKAFTEARLEEIRLVEEEIEFLGILQRNLTMTDSELIAIEGIIVREQAALSELKRGMRGA